MKQKNVMGRRIHEKVSNVTTLDILENSKIYENRTVLFCRTSETLNLNVASGYGYSVILEGSYVTSFTNLTSN